MFGWLFKSKPVVKNCLQCEVEVDPETSPQMKFRYIENNEPKIGIAFLCEGCAKELEPVDDE